MEYPTGNLSKGSSLPTTKRAVARGLLQLPAEIRARIWIETLGGRHIHVWADGDRRGPTGCLLGYELDHDICTAPGKLRTDGYHTVTSKELSASRSEPPEFTNWDLNHSRCRYRKRVLGANDPRLDLAILRTSRQAYDESSDVLLSTNTFCFDLSGVFAQFMKNYGPLRCCTIRYLYLAMSPHQMELAAVFKRLSWDGVPTELDIECAAAFKGQSKMTAPEQTDTPTPIAKSTSDPFSFTPPLAANPQLYFQGLRDVHVTMPDWKLPCGAYYTNPFSRASGEEFNAFKSLIELPRVHITITIDQLLRRKNGRTSTLEQAETKLSDPLVSLRPFIDRSDKIEITYQERQYYEASCVGNRR